MPSNITPDLLFAVIGTLSSIATFSVWLMRGQSWAERLMLGVMKSDYGRKAIEKVAMDSLQGAAGQEAVRRASREHLELKMDNLAYRITELASRIDTMGTKLEKRLDKLDDDMQNLHVRVSLLEQRTPPHRGQIKEID